MARPTLAAQLAKAVELGDMDQIKILSAKLLLSQTKAKPKKKKVVRTTQKKKQLVVIPDDENIEEIDLGDLESEEEEEVERSETSDFIAPARKPNRQNKYVDEDGKERKRAKVVPFKVQKNRKNTFRDNENEYAADIELDKKLHKHGVVRGDGRQPIKKVKVRCKRCNEVFVVWPGEVKHKNWACDECLTSNKP